MDDMYICLCGDVRESQIKNKIKEGINTVEQLQEDLGLLCGCGTCYDDVLRVIAEETK